MAARHALVSGLVQGVALRWHARERARALGLAGWIKNLPDGRVETLFEGDDAATRGFATWLRRGPRAARVDGLELRDAEPEGARGFEIV